MSTLEAHYLADDIQRYLERWRIPSRIAGIVLQLFHLMAFLFGFYLLFQIESRPGLFTYLMIILFVAVTQIYFRGCFLTLLEKKLMKSSWTIFDYLFRLHYQIHQLLGIPMLKNGSRHKLVTTLKWITAAILIAIWFLIFR